MSSTHDADVIVIGSGPGGLTCAAYLAAMGKKVLVIEQHYQAGGNATTFTHQGHEFDVGLHYIGECGPGGALPRLLRPLGIDLAFRELDPDGFDTFVLPDLTFRWPKGWDALRARLVETFPAERRAVNTYLDTIRGLNDAVYGLQRGLSVDDALAMPGRIARLVRHRNTTLGAFLDGLGASPRLRAVLSGHHGIYALPPSKASLLVHAMIVAHYAGGAYYPEGGGGVLGKALVEAVERNGGEILTRTSVERIIVEDGRARGVEVHHAAPERHAGAPDRYTAPAIVSNADLKRTYLDLVGPEHLPADVVARTRAYRMAPPLSVEFLVVDGDLAAEGIPNSNFWISGLDVEEQYALIERGEISPDPFAYVSSATLKDPGNHRAAPPGQTNLQVMTVAPPDHEFWHVSGSPADGVRYRTTPEYVDAKRDLGDRVIKQAERVIPGLSERLLFHESSSPITYERFTHATGGTSYGIAATPDQSFLHRPMPTTPIDGLWLTGANTVFMHGIVATIMGGMVTATLVNDGNAWKALSGGLLVRRVRDGAAPAAHGRDPVSS